jgi:putative peptidoglycan lipid II flippase
MKLYKSFATVGGLTFLSRILGFVRDTLAAMVLGAGPVADAFYVAFRFPNLFRRLFGEGAFNSAFVPMFADKLEGEGKDAARAFAEEALAGLAFVVIIVSALCMIFMPWLMYLLAPGFADTPAKFDLAVQLTRITFPYLLCMSLVALASGVLNSLGKFGESSSVSIVLNVVLAAAMMLSVWLGYRNEDMAGYIQAWGVFVAGILQLVLLIWGLKRHGFTLKLRWPRWTEGMKNLVALGIPGVIAGGITQLNILIGTMIATQQDGAVSHLYYADRLYELPLAIVGIAIGVVLLPEVTRHLRAGNTAEVMSSQNRSLEFAMLLTVPAAVALAIVPTDLVKALFEYGAFTPADTPYTANALAIFALGLPAFVLIKVFSPAFFARQDTKTPMRYAGWSLTLNTIGSVALFFVFRKLGWMPHLGIAVATSIGGWINAILLWRGLQSRGYFAADDQFKRALPRILISSVVMGVGLYALSWFLAPYIGGSTGFAVRFTALMVLIGGGLGLYALAAWLTGAIRPNQFKAAFRRKV